MVTFEARTRLNAVGTNAAELAFDHPMDEHDLGNSSLDTARHSNGV